MNSSDEFRRLINATQTTRFAYSKPTFNSSATRQLRTRSSRFFVTDLKIACCTRLRIIWKGARLWWKFMKRQRRTGSPSVSIYSTCYFKGIDNFCIIVKLCYFSWNDRILCTTSANFEVWNDTKPRNFSDGDLGGYADARKCYMKQKHRLIWERRHGPVGSGMNTTERSADE